MELHYNDAWTYNKQHRRKKNTHFEHDILTCKNFLIINNEEESFFRHFHFFMYGTRKSCLCIFFSRCFAWYKCLCMFASIFLQRNNKKYLFIHLLNIFVFVLRLLLIHRRFIIFLQHFKVLYEVLYAYWYT